RAPASGPVGGRPTPPPPAAGVPSSGRRPPPPPPAAGGPASAPRPPPPAAGAPPPKPEGITEISAAAELTARTMVGGRYQVERILGRGGMGAVYAVRHVNTGETLALKLLHPALAANAQAVERFRTEARAPVRIGTDHVVRVIDADLSAELGVPFLVMELLQ